MGAMLFSVKPLDGEVTKLDTNDETTILQVMQKIHDRSEYRNMSIQDLEITNMNGKGWGFVEHLKISELNLQEENTVRLFTHHLEQQGFVRGYEAAIEDFEKKAMGKDKDKKPERYTIATPATSSVVEGSDIGSDIGSVKNLFFLIAGLPGSGKSTGLANAMNSPLQGRCVRAGAHQAHPVPVRGQELRSHGLSQEPIPWVGHPASQPPADEGLPQKRGRHGADHRVRRSANDQRHPHC